MSHEALFKMAIKRREAFDNLEKYLQRIREVARKIDGEAEVYLFGSVAENRSIYSSDIDVLIATNAEPGRMHLELWKAGIGDPFEIHIEPPERAKSIVKNIKPIEADV
jgi:predicted nucleotidyltransferase